MRDNFYVRRLSRGVGLLALSTGVFFAAPAVAADQQGGATATSASPADESDGSDIIVTGSRIERKGFDQPTPTTVIGESELRNGARPNIQEVLNDVPQFRATISPATTITNQSTGTAPVDLRGLGVSRTLTLLNGRRFAGENNLNFLPLDLVRRVVVVTGGASAAYGSGAVAGVVNIILNDKLSGLSLGAQSGISSRGDAARYMFSGSFGTAFAEDKGHFIIGAEYVDDQGIGPNGRLSRPNLGAGIIRINPTSATDQRTQLVGDVNYGNTALAGLITTGTLAGQVFNADGTLRPFRGGVQVGAAAFNANQVGGVDASSFYDSAYVMAPLKRLSSYARLSYDIGNAKLWVDASYGRAVSDYPWVPDLTLTSVTVSASNPFLSQTIRNQLAGAGETSFTLGRYFPDAYTMNYNNIRENYEGAIGIEGRIGRFKYNAHYSHGEVTNDSHANGGRILSRYANAINAVAGPGGVPVCAINADAITTNDDPACAPINPFGYGNVSQAAIAYTTGQQTAYTRYTLDAAGAQIQGDIFSLPAGPVTAVVGGEMRFEQQTARSGTEGIASTFAIPVFTSTLAGKFNVKEAFAELVVPVINAPGTFKLDLNGAARYSYYSTSGGIWSWKAGATARVFDDLLLRVTRSRDIRSPSISELFLSQRLSFVSITDAQAAKYAGTPGYNPNPPFPAIVTGGNPNLVPEIGTTLTTGVTYSPAFVPGLSLSVDYYDISVAGAIFTLNGSQITQACNAGSVAACAAITRDATGTVTAVQANAQNLANFKTTGLDFEVVYTTSLSQIGAEIPGTISLRALATYVDQYILNTGVSSVDTAGDVGNTVANGIPKWRGAATFAYQNSDWGFDVRLRYIDGGKFDHLQNVATSGAGVTTGLVNNDISSRTYVDIGAHAQVHDRLTLFASANNIFDRSPPLVTSTTIIHDVVGTYFNFGAKVKF